MPLTLAPTDLATATDADLDRALTRLYGLHLELGGTEREECHEAIMDVLGEMGARLDAWLVEHGASTVR